MPMMSLWPWRADHTSPASFEKALSTLATKISKTQAQLDRTRSTARRIKVLWTLYLSFAYLVYTIVLVLVVGWTNMGPWEWTGVAGGPVLIYGTRTLLATFFNFRADSLGAKLKGQQAERAKTIQKLKDATKYDSTQELLKKYGGTEAQPAKGAKADGERIAGGGDHGGQGAHGTPRGTPGRTNMPPPPTANIPRGDGRIPASGRGTPQPDASSPLRLPPVEKIDTMAEFAPNAYDPDTSSVAPSAQYALTATGAAETHWYDRIMDLLLGDDETAAKNRIVLICRSCRLVNGQAPPGTRSLAEIGTWTCMGCGATNGEADEAHRIVKEVLGDRLPTAESATDGDSSDVVEVGREDQDEADAAQGQEASSRAKQRKGKGKAK